MSKELLVNLLAKCFLGGDPGLDAILNRCANLLGKRWLWLRSVAKNYLASTAGKTGLRQRQVADFILHDRVFGQAWEKHSSNLRVQQFLTQPQQMQPVAAANAWDLPRIESAAELADWFWLEPTQLDWFADLNGLAYKTHKHQLRHYHYRVLQKTSGGHRLIEAPKPRLKEMQRQILELILDRIPAHSATHGFVKGRSILTFAASHVDQRVVLRMDLQDFFPSFSAARIQTFFRTIGYPESVADLLGGICSSATPREVWQSIDNRAYSGRHLPQGAPTSPALANLCAYRMDCRLSGLAKAAGAEYSRYADDLAFSGGPGFAKHVDRFSLHAAAILMEEGFSVQHRKTRIMRQGVRQHLAGLVTNQTLNVPRSDFDKLKAILTNCARRGPESQNHAGQPAFREHLHGRISFLHMVNPGKAARLRAIFERIVWP